jgi:Ni/Co efflux regulator RcnB
MKRIVLMTLLFAFLAGASFAKCDAVNNNQALIACIDHEQGEKTKDSSEKKESKRTSETKSDEPNSSSKAPCSKSCERTCKGKSSSQKKS